MKKIFKTVALLTALSMVAAGCQKEPMLNPQTTTINEGTAINVTYMVDGRTNQASFSSDDDWHAFLDLLFTWAEEGRDVSFGSVESYANNVKKDRKVVTYTTENKKDAEEWASAMEKEGYYVHIDFDETTGIYTCIAIM